ncbi:MAG: AAA family ATPase [Myxococcales bacterium]|nr:AAA family ATPase [Myxococcales bacterium]
MSAGSNGRAIKSAFGGLTPEEMARNREANDQKAAELHEAVGRGEPEAEMALAEPPVPAEIPLHFGPATAVLWLATRSNAAFDDLRRKGITKRHFIGAARKAWMFIETYRRDHGMVPPASLVSAEFQVVVEPPEGELEHYAAANGDIGIAPSYVVEGLLANAQHRAVEHCMGAASEKLREGDLTEAVAEIRRFVEAERDGRWEARQLVRKEASESLLDRLQASWGRECVGYPMPGFPRLQAALSGLRGWTLVTAAPGTGKTTLLAQMCANIVEANEAVACVIVSRELEAMEIEIDWLARWSGCETEHVFLGIPRERRMFSGRTRKHANNDALRADLVEAHQRLMRLGERLTIIDRSEGETSVARVRDELERIKRDTGATKALVLVDPLSAWPLAGKNKNATENQEDRERVEEMIRLVTAIGADNMGGGALVTVAEQRKGNSKGWNASDMQDVTVGIFRHPQVEPCQHRMPGFLHR